MKNIKSFDEYQSIDEGVVSDLAKKAFSLLMAPVALPTFMNANTNFKLKVIESAVDKYLKSRAEYEIVDDIRYDLEMPSQLKKATKIRNEISKKIKKFPTLNAYKENFCKWLRKFNVINFRNKIDIDYLCDKIMQIKPGDEKEYIDEIKDLIKYNPDTGKFENRSYREIDLERIRRGRQP